MNYSSLLKDYIITNCLGLAVGDTLPNDTCPFCKGGLNNDKSFSISRTSEGYLYNCYRASCGKHGFYGTATTPYTDKRPKEFQPRPYPWACVSLSEEQRSTFTVRFGLTPAELRSSGVLYNPERDSFAWPIRDYRGYEVGIMDRSYSGRKPKSIVYWFNDVPKLYFPSGVELFSDRVVLVEDVLSSIKGNRYVPTLAILGTSVTSSDISSIASLFRHASFALDSDATSKSIKLAKTYSLYFKDGCSVIKLDKDIKDMDDESIKGLLL